MKTVNLVLICLLACRTGHAVKPTSPIGQTVHFRTIQSALIAVPVTLNGRGPFEFVLDTGTDTSIVDINLVHELSLHSGEEVVLLSATGQQTSSRSFVDRVALGTAVWCNVEVLAMDVDSIFHNRKVRGVLGQNFLSQFDIFLDYRNGSVTLLSPGDRAPMNGVRVPLSLEHGRPALLWRNEDGRDLRLLVDSGTSSLIFFTTDVPGFQLCAVSICQGTMGTVISTSVVRSGVLSRFALGDAVLRDVPAFYSAQNAVGDRLDGMLPTGIFRSVYIDNHKGFAVFSPGSP